MANPFKRLDDLIIELFGFSNRGIIQRLDRLQADVNLIKSVLLVEDPGDQNSQAQIDAAEQKISDLTNRLKSSNDRLETVLAVQK